ncbi:MAG: CHASE2 domain-containing protein [Burkholderiaceae bacterium]
MTTLSALSPRSRNALIRSGLGLLLALVFWGHALQLWHLPLLDELDNTVYDTQVRSDLGRTSPDPRVVILDIDEKSLASDALGRWPWSRDKMSALVDRLFDDYGVAVLSFDVVFSEPDLSSGLQTLNRLAVGPLKGNTAFTQSLAQLAPTLDYDGRFENTIAARPIVMGYYFTASQDAGKTGGLPAPVLLKGDLDGLTTTFPAWQGYGANLPQFADAALVGGHFNPIVDIDGIVRRVPALVQYDGDYYESLALATLRLYWALQDTPPGKPLRLPGIQAFAANGETTGLLEYLQVGKRLLPVDSGSNMFVPYKGPAGSIAYYSMLDLLEKKIDPAALKDKIVMVGTTAPGLVDLRATPVSGIYPGVEIHANVVAALLNADTKADMHHRPQWLIDSERLAFLALGLLFLALLPWLSPGWSAGVTVASLAGLFVAAELLWQTGLVAHLAGMALLIGCLFILNMAYGFFVEARSKRQFTELFGQYVPPELVAQMAENPEQYNMQGRRENLTVLFSDVRGFTSISEQLSPTDLASFINEYLTSMSQVIRDHGGTLDKYIGDAIMAFWGAPVQEPRHALMGVKAALAMKAELTHLRARFQARGWPDIMIGIGLSSGDMTVGDMGSQVRKAYTVMGDAVNLGSRLEGLTKHYGAWILVPQRTVDECPEVVFREIDKVRVKGKDEPITIYEPVCLQEELTPDLKGELTAWQEAMQCFKAQDFSAAIARLDLLLSGRDHDLRIELFIERARYLLDHPPGPDWDGVTKFDTK